MVLNAAAAAVTIAAVSRAVDGRSLPHFNRVLNIVQWLCVCRSTVGMQCLRVSCGVDVCRMPCSLYRRRRWRRRWSTRMIKRIVVLTWNWNMNCTPPTNQYTRKMPKTDRQTEYRSTRMHTSYARTHTLVARLTYIVWIVYKPNVTHDKYRIMKSCWAATSLPSMFF